MTDDPLWLRHLTRENRQNFQSEFQYGSKYEMSMGEFLESVLHNTVAACTSLSRQHKSTSAVDSVLDTDVHYSSSTKQFLMVRQAKDSHEPSL